MSYTKINWADGEAGGTPINAANLDKMDQGIYDNDDKVSGASKTEIGYLAGTTSAIQTQLNNKLSTFTRLQDHYDSTETSYSIDLSSYKYIYLTGAYMKLYQNGTVSFYNKMIPISLVNTGVLFRATEFEYNNIGTYYQVEFRYDSTNKIVYLRDRALNNMKTTIWGIK